MNTAFWEIVKTIPENKCCLGYIKCGNLVADVDNLCMGALTEDLALY
jgi:hypothetical protein